MPASDRESGAARPAPFRAIGVEPFEAAGALFHTTDGDPEVGECHFVEDGDSLAVDPTGSAAPDRIGFVDGTLRTEARLTRMDQRGRLQLGLAGTWAAGAVLVSPKQPARFSEVEVRRTSIFLGGHSAEIPPHPRGWLWEPQSVPGDELQDAYNRLRLSMREVEAKIAERLCSEGWLTVLDGPLHGLRRQTKLPVLGYVKSHHRRLLPVEEWGAVTAFTQGQRSRLFVLDDDRYACYLRVGDAGPWASPWGGIARVEVPSGVGEESAVRVANDAQCWLPRFGSALHRDTRAPVNLTPIAGLERHLRHLFGDQRLALRSLRESVRSLDQGSPSP